MSTLVGVHVTAHSHSLVAKHVVSLPTFGIGWTGAAGCGV